MLIVNRDFIMQFLCRKLYNKYVNNERINLRKLRFNFLTNKNSLLLSFKIVILL